jgi:hypothetical protein
MTTSRKLSPQTLPYLYDEAVYRIDRSKPAYSGNLEKGVLVLTDTPPDPAESALLDKMLQAVGLRQAEVTTAVLGRMPEGTGFEEIAAWGPARILAFSQGSVLDRRFPVYTQQEVGAIRVLCAHPLRTMQHDVEMKKKFWQCLKEMFGI